MILIGLLAILTLLGLWAVVRGRSRPVRHVSEAPGLIRDVDLDAFRNLISHAQRQYLQAHLSPQSFRKLQRARHVATAEYLLRVAHNAAVLMRLGEAAQTGSDPELSRAGAALTSLAITTRIYASLALIEAGMGFLFPSWNISFGSVADRYERLTASFGMVHMLWRAPMAGA